MAKTILQELIAKAHDEVLQQNPETPHDESTCDICIAMADDDPQGGRTVSGETFTKADLDAAVAEAIAPFVARVQELEAADHEAEVDAKVAAAKAEVETQLAEVQIKLDEAQIKLQAAEEKATAAEAQAETVQKAWDDEKAAVEAAEALEAKKEERVAEVKEVASFDDDYLTANAERWANMEDDIFKATLEDYKTVAAKAGKSAGTTIPTRTVLETASRDGGGKSALGRMTEMYAAGYDPRRVIQS